MIAEIGSPSPRPSPQRGEGEVPSVCRRNSSRGGNSRPKYARVILVIVPCDHPFGTEAPAGPPGRGFFLNSCQIFPSSKGFPKHLPAMKGAVMVPPPHHLFLRWEPEAPLPRAGLLSFVNSPLRGGGIALEQPQTPPLPLGRGRPLCGRVRGRLNSISGRLSPPHPNPLPKGRGSPPALGSDYQSQGTSGHATGYSSNGPASP